MAKLNELEVVANDQNLCGEAPIWDNGRGRLVWTDVERELVYQYIPKTGAKAVISRGRMVAGIALHKTPGGFIFAGSGGMVRWKGPGNADTIVTTHDGEKLHFNDIIADAKGRIYAGTVYWGARTMHKPGKLYLIDTRRQVTVVDEGNTMSNGLGFSPDNRTLYHVDSAARRIYAFDVDTKTGKLSRKRVLVNVPKTEGLPEGLTVDADGYIWCAQWYGSQVVRYRPDGTVERRLAIPARQVTSVAFGGDELKDLYITTAGKAWESPLMPPGYDAKAGPVGGSLYRIHVNAQGRPEHLAGVM
jgi:D-xylonolactonase